MTHILVTGSDGFIGRNLCVALDRMPDCKVLRYDLGVASETLEGLVGQSQCIIHLAGVNRPEDPTRFDEANVGFTERLIHIIKNQQHGPLVIFASSMQAVLDNPYGKSKKRAEESLASLSQECGVPVRVFRLAGAFGKWCRPNYNSVVATFCHNIAHDLGISISDPNKVLQLVYIDDIVHTFMSLAISTEEKSAFAFGEVLPVYSITLGHLAGLIRGFRDSRDTLLIADGADRLVRSLHATYLSYLPLDAFEYSLRAKSDSRGELAELLKSSHFGQMFVSRTHPGVIRGKHYHDSKIEKFCVVEGDAIVRFRHILTDEVHEYRISGTDFKVIDIPPGYTHSIENVGSRELVVLFWANEIFDPESPDTYFAEV